MTDELEFPIPSLRYLKMVQTDEEEVEEEIAERDKEEEEE